MDEAIATERLSAEVDAVMEEYLFEMNSPALRENVVENVTDLLSRRVYTPIVVCDDSNNSEETIKAHQLFVDIRFKWTESDEDFTSLPVRVG